MDIVFATKNQGKVKEVKAILGGIGVDVQTMTEAGVDIEIVEDGSTFEENAIKKAKEVMSHCGKIVLSDDSGLEIDYLDGAPGVYSARYLGEDTPYIIKNTHILQQMENVPQEQRGARFVCVIAAAFPDGRVFTARGVIEGQIALEIKGSGGFGYDPIFYVPKLKKSLAEVSAEEKNALSHRGKALKAMCKQLEGMML